MGKSIATERRWPSMLFTPVTIAGGIVTLPPESPLTKYVKEKQKVTLTKPGLEAKDFEVRRVLSDFQIQLGPAGNPFKSVENPVEFSGGSLSVIEQERNQMTGDVVFRAVYEEGPTSALRNVLVDHRGHFYSADNPLSVQLADGSINIGTVNAELEVQLAAEDNYPNLGDVHDSVRIGSGVLGTYLEIYPSKDIDIRSIGRTPEEKTKGDLLCSSDLDRDMTWAEIDGVRRVTQIVFTSANLDAATGDTITLTRTFTYQVADPFDLIEVKDTLTVV